MLRIYRDITGPCLAPDGSVLTIGAFDGLHRGHTALLARVHERALALGLTSAAISFEPLPRGYFSPTPLRRLSSVREKLCGFADAGIDVLLLLRFRAPLVAMSAEDFVRKVLVARMRAHEVWVGKDFRFGHDRVGDVALLEAMQGEGGYEVRVLDAVSNGDGERISASRVRGALGAGDFAHARDLLGRPFVIGGRVVRGQRMGRKLGYPTANIRLGKRVSPVAGIFAVRVRVDGRWWPGVASLGVRPTIAGGGEPLLEAHLFDFDGDLYGDRIEVEFVAKLRDEEKFADLDALRVQMDRDAAAARRILADTSVFFRSPRVSRDYKHTINLPQTAFAMKADLARREPAMLAEWESAQRYADLQRHTGARARAFILHDGPPYANGKIHLGHAVNKILKDIVVRSKLMAGFRSPYVPGWDCHGLPIEIAVEKKYGKVGHKIDAETFRQHCRDYAAQQIDLQRRDFKRLGVLGDWEHPYRTMDFRYEADILRALAGVYANGHVTRGFKPVHWCFDCGSALAEAEIEYQDKQSPAIDVAYDALDPKALAAKFGVTVNDDTIVAVPIWTTTPWTLPASMAVTLGPELDYVLVEGPMRGGKRVLLVLAEALVDKALARYPSESLPPLAGGEARRAEGGNVLGRAKGADIASLPPLQGEGRGGDGVDSSKPTPTQTLPLRGRASMLRHPFYDREVPLILGEHVSAEDGTGAVHTAPGHGADDFVVGQKYGIVAATPANVLNPVGANGVYLPGTPVFAGQHIWKANDAIIELLRERGMLLAVAKITHSYPHCWRHHTPIAFRTTPQWFIAMDTKGLRANALHAVHHDVAFFPAWGEERIASMVEDRPDWCISRQRTWGVPIALAVHKVTGEPHPRSAELLERVAGPVEKDGVDAWYALDLEDLLGEEAKDYEKVRDILDVWFDSGVTHFCVLDQRPELHRNEGDQVMYLEGSDQHRGWFQSSLLTSCAMHGRAPFDEVLTHGFTVDAQGRKMSKSLGNGIEPQDVMNKYGADILRLWIASADYRNEMALSEEILKRVADSYRRIRNTCRFLLGNLDGFDPAADLLTVDRCLLLDQWAIRSARDVQDAVVAAYARYDFPEVVQRVQNFCTNEMGALYLDITKDRLYTMPTTSHGRRSAQSAMYRILEAMVRWLAPLFAFTSEEIWQAMPRQMHMPTEIRGGFTARDASVLYETWYQGLRETQNTPEQRRWWSDLLAIRETAGRVLEGMRKDGRIGSSLDATLTLHADPAIVERYKQAADELRFFFIVSDLRLDVGEAPADAVLTELEGANVWVSAGVSTAPKCVRCWHHREDVGRHSEHPELCGRCVGNVSAFEGKGTGETRRWF